MSNKININTTVQSKMEAEWQIEISEAPFINEKGANMPSFGYPCGVCGSQETKLRFAESTTGEESVLAWIELQCKDCRNYTKYTRK
jgi:hypothetical protein